MFTKNVDLKFLKCPINNQIIYHLCLRNERENNFNVYFSLLQP